MFNDTWSFDRAENSWMDLDPGGPLPPARWGHSMVYCPDTKSMLLFGGMTEDGSTNDLWSYDPASNTWTEFEPAGPLPSPRSDQATAYDIAAGRLILFGGWDDNDQILGDTWAYDPGANAWTELEPSGAAPPPRAIAAMTYDRASGRVILFGGFDQQRQFNDVWAFSF
jgi:N-acetylneuraminic acid mutarotase